ncbi:RhoGEF domain [Carpediemonas membranifera]|uniref:RhoGEF domain n=1 Tax=Carpediemonas membranifera TaxID=201153 RepID=A0A8J6C0C6_9EUKA|nr:RhoGEF domain [Carpediemonas membranifera]|eukprot:KAG9396441.1 RhoGEF domain [Carpediemonas membranifera]
MVVAYTDGLFALWSSDLKLKDKAQHGGQISCLAVSSEIATAGNGRVMLWSSTGANLLDEKHVDSPFTNSIAFSHAGRSLAVDDGNAIRVWDVGQGAGRRFMGHRGVVNSLRFIRGDSIVSVSEDTRMCIWDTVSGKIRNEQHLDSVFQTIALSPDGLLLASGSAAGCKVWDTDTWQCVASLGSVAGCRCVAFSHDGSTIACSFDTDSDAIDLFSVGSGRSFATLRGHTDAVTSLAFSPRRSTLLSGSKDGTARVWTMFNRPPLTTAEEVCSHTITAADSICLGAVDPLSVVDFARAIDHTLTRRNETPRLFEAHVCDPCGRIHNITMQFGRLRTHSDNPTSGVQAIVAVWNSATAPIDCTTAIPLIQARSLAAMPDGSVVLGCNKCARIYDYSGRRREVIQHSSAVRCVSVSAAGIVAVADQQKICLWTSMGDRLATLRCKDEPVSALSFSPDGRMLLAACCGKKKLRLWMSDNDRWTFWKTREVNLQRKTGAPAAGVAFSPDINAHPSFAVASASRVVIFWVDGRTIREAHNIPGPPHSSSAKSIAFSGDGSILAIGYCRKTVKVFTTVDWRCILTIALRSETRVTHVDVSADGAMVAAGTSDGLVSIWSTQGDFIGDLASPAPSPGEVRGVAFLPNGMAIAVTYSRGKALYWALKHSALFTNDMARLLFQPAKNATIAVPSPNTAKEPVLLSDAARLLVHSVATGQPSVFTVTVDPSSVTLTMDRHRFCQATSPTEISSSVVELLEQFNTIPVGRMTDDFCNGSIPLSEVSFPPHSGASAAHLERIATEAVSSNAGVPLDFSLTLDHPPTTVKPDQAGCLVSDPPDAVVDGVLRPFNVHQRDRTVAAITSTPVSPDDSIIVTHADLDTLITLVDRLKTSGVSPNVFSVSLDEPAEAQVKLDGATLVVTPPNDVVSNAVRSFTFLGAYRESIMTADAVRIGDHCVLTKDDLRDVLAILRERTRDNPPFSFHLTLTLGPDQHLDVTMDEDKFLVPSASDDWVDPCLLTYNGDWLSQWLDRFELTPVSAEDDVRVTHADSPALQQILDHIVKSGTIPRSLKVTLVDSNNVTVQLVKGCLYSGKGSNAQLEDFLKGQNRRLFGLWLDSVCSCATTEQSEIRFEFRHDWLDCTSADLERVINHIVASAVVPLSFSMQLSAPNVVVSMNDAVFIADRADAEIDKFLDTANIHLTRAVAARRERVLKNLAVTFFLNPPTGAHFVHQAIALSALLEAHPLLDAVAPEIPEVVEGPIQTSTRLRERVQHARLSPRTRTDVYTELLVEAKACRATLNTRVEASKANWDAATALLVCVQSFGHPLPSWDDMAELLKLADGCVAEFPMLKTDLSERYATLRAFLEPRVRSTWHWAEAILEHRDTRDTTALKQLDEFITEATIHLSMFSVADKITTEYNSLGGDLYHIKNKAELLGSDIAHAEQVGRHAEASKHRAELEKVRGTMHAMHNVLARRTPQLLQLCPELDALGTLSSSDFVKLREIGLAHLMDLPEMRADLVFSDFKVVSTVSDTRALCQIVKRNGRSYFAKTFKLKNEQERKLCDREAGILSRMAHSPTVPRLHFVLVNMTEQTCTIIMEHLESHLRDAPADSPDSLRRLLHGLLTAIHDLHSAGVCHRDLKPENVMLREGHPVLVDFETASNMDAVNATATEVNIGTLAFSAPEEIAARNAGRKLSHREQQAADVYHAGLTMLAVMASDYATFCLALLSHSNNKDLADASTVDDDALCDALMKTVTVPDALRDLLSGMLATHPEARWSVSDALSNGVFSVSPQNLAAGPVGLFRAAAAEVSRRMMKNTTGVDLAFSGSISDTLSSIGELDGAMSDYSLSINGESSLVELIDDLSRASVPSGDDSAPLFRDGTLALTPAALNLPMDTLSPVLLGVGRVLQLLLLEDISLPAGTVSLAWLEALKDGQVPYHVDLSTLCPGVYVALRNSIDDARTACPLDGFECDDLKTYTLEVQRRYHERMNEIRHGLFSAGHKEVNPPYIARMFALTPAQLRALLVRPNPLSVDAVLAPLRFPRGGQRVQNALRTLLAEDDEMSRRFVFHMFGGQLPQARGVPVILADDSLMFTVQDRGVTCAHIPSMDDVVGLRLALLNSAPTLKRYQRYKYVNERRHCFLEMLSTEKTYSANLGFLVGEVLPRWRRQAWEFPWYVRDPDELFPLIQELSELSQSVAEELNTLDNDFDSEQTIVSAFFRGLRDKLHIFERYLQQLPKTRRRIIKAASADQPFSSFVASIRDMPQNPQKLYLDSILIMPVQRIARYPMMLSALLKNTWPFHPDFVGLTRALREIDNKCRTVQKVVPL